MSDTHVPDWHPDSKAVRENQRDAYDDMRERCPVAYSDARGWSIFRHEDVARILNDPASFSNAVSSHRAVPNGMDPPEHTMYRAIIDRYFTPERVAIFEPVCREIVASLLSDGLASANIELMADFAVPFASRVQCAFLGWPAHMASSLAKWAQKNYEATRAGDRNAITKTAREFQHFIDDRIEACLQDETGPAEEVTADLMLQEVRERPLNNEEIASILRNWTVGEIGTIAASVGILVHFVAGHPDLQEQFRRQPGMLPAAIDEILRIDGPLVSNRRVTTCPVTIAGRAIDAGERISVNWIAANRDSRVIEDPDSFRLDRDYATNLLYGAGIHICPGAPLARMELRVTMEELLQRTARIQLVPDSPAARAAYPASGFSTLPLRLEWAS